MTKHLHGTALGRFSPVVDTSDKCRMWLLTYRLPRYPIRVADYLKASKFIIMPSSQNNKRSKIQQEVPLESRDDEKQFIFVKAQAPVNIAVIKYWGKANEDLKVPINDSLSGTLSMDDMCTTTSVYLSSDTEDQLVLNGEPINLTKSSPASKMLDDIRAIASLDEKRNGRLLGLKAHIESYNNFPTAAGLASSAAGYACLAYALGHAYNITDPTLLSKIARKGSGSACRSLFGGFVHWVKGTGHDDSVAQQVVDHVHWPDMRVVICVVNDEKKDISSSSGMLQSVQTSQLIQHRAERIVPVRLDEIKQAIHERDFETFAQLTMQDSNEFHAICLDTYPPIFYLNETSKQIIRVCHLINEFYHKINVAYTFDAGPNACIYLLEAFVPTFIGIMNHLFPVRDDDGTNEKLLPIKGRPYKPNNLLGIAEVVAFLRSKNVNRLPNSVKYLINTSIGEGPRLIEKRTTRQ